MGWIRTAVGLAISVLALYLSLRGIRLDVLRALLPQTHLGLFLLAAGLHFLSYFLRGWRWQIMLRPVRRLRYGPVLGSLLLGFLGNNILPARLGEVVRALALGYRTGVSRSAAFSSVLLVRFFDGAATVGLAAVALLFVPLPSALRPLVVLSTLLFFGVFPAYYLLYWNRVLLARLFTRVVQKMPVRWRPWLTRIAEGTLGGLQVLRAPRELLWTAGLTLFIWGLEGWSYHMAFWALGVSPPVPVTLLAMVAINLSVMLPSAPGYLGVFEYACIVSLTPFGLSRELALSFALLSHVIRILVPTFMGIVVLLHWGIRFQDLQMWSKTKVSHD